jgi:rhodanese-related sulfurtransferase
MNSHNLTPAEAAALLDKGASLVDIRGEDEHRRERIPGAALHPQATLAVAEITGDKLIFHCRTGMRTRMSAGLLAQAAGSRPWYVLDGGLEAWKRAGQPVTRSPGQPIELQRQVMIAAGSLILLGTLLTIFASPYFISLPLLIGAGLTFAGLSGFCGMARLLMLAPWNR